MVLIIERLGERKSVLGAGGNNFKSGTSSAQRRGSEMKKILLSLAIAVTACNLTIGLGYAAVCQSSTGARSCGTKCAALSDGSCGCQGECSAEERNWVAGAKGGDDEELLEAEN